MLVIGLTGSLATGKSTVANMFAQLGAFVLDADKIAHEQMQTKACLDLIVKAFDESLVVNGKIDRKKLGKIVFQDDQKRKILENIIHPVVIKYMRDKIRSCKKSQQADVIVIDVPLLFEVNLDDDVDLSIVVKATRKNQTERAFKRWKMTKTEISRRIKAQMPLRTKIRLADIIIDNNGTLTQTKKQVKSIWEELWQEKKN